MTRRRNKDYDHEKKAGNLGDQLKHMVLLETVNHMLNTGVLGHPAKMNYMETHSGRPYSNMSEKRVRELDPIMPERLYEVAGSGYGTVMRHQEPGTREGDVLSWYASSWLQVATYLKGKLVKPTLTLYETQELFARRNGEVLNQLGFAGASQCGDGWAALEGLTREQCDLVFIDPPYLREENGVRSAVAKDWSRMHRLTKDLNGVRGLVWFPVYNGTKWEKAVEKAAWPTLVMKLPEAPNSLHDLMGSGFMFVNFTDRDVAKITKEVQARPEFQILMGPEGHNIQTVV